ncbi:MAG: BON domain-containing protein [Desulfamplus sp.]|nr:BON domain-containing protein [Desulfamplus sp.]
MNNIPEVKNESLGLDATTGAPIFEVKADDPYEDKNAWLAAKVKSTLLSYNNVNGAEIDVLVERGGVVTLYGKASSRAHKDLVTEYTKDVEGVIDVENEMIVPVELMKSGETTLGEKLDGMNQLIDDASITAMVKAKLLYNRSTSALNTIVQTEHGVVNLSGIAKNTAEKELATKLVSDVHGVKTVINTIRVEKSDLQNVA